MGSAMEETELLQRPQILSPCSSGRRSSVSNSPEFEFWMVRNPSFPQHDLLSADQLFSDGVLLPLHLLHPPASEEPPDPNPNPHPPPEKSDFEAETAQSGSERPESQSGHESDPLTVPASLSTAGFTPSKRWKDIFKKSERKSSCNAGDDCIKEREKEKKKEKKGGSANNGVNAAELNINIWPFSRSRSAGNGGSRPKMTTGSAVTTRKVSSAPCSRSNSAGESKSRKWPSSPNRGGVYLGRSSPIWQVRRSAAAGINAGRSIESAIAKNPEKGPKKEGNEARRKVSAGGVGAPPKARVLNINVPTCIGYRSHLSCRSDENSAVNSMTVAVPGDVQSGGSVTGEGVRGSNLFNIRSLFTKKVY